MEKVNNSLCSGHSRSHKGQDVDEREVKAQSFALAFRTKVAYSRIMASKVSLTVSLILSSGPYPRLALVPLSGFIHRPAGTLNMKGYWIIATHCPGLTLEQSYFPRLICLVERKIALEKCETVQELHAKKARKTLSVQSNLFSRTPQQNSWLYELLDTACWSVFTV